MMGASGSHTAATIQSDANYMLNPVEGALNDAADTLGSYWSTLTQLDDVRTQNEQLRQENQTLQEELNRMPAISQLNDRLDEGLPGAAELAVPDDDRPGRRPQHHRHRPADLHHQQRAGRRDLARARSSIDDGGAVVGRVRLGADVRRHGSPGQRHLGRGDRARNADPGAIGNDPGPDQRPPPDVVRGLDRRRSRRARRSSPRAWSSQAEDVRSPYPPGLLIGTIISVSTRPEPGRPVGRGATRRGSEQHRLGARDHELPGRLLAAPSRRRAPARRPRRASARRRQPTPAIPRVTPTPGPTPTPPPGLVTPPPH